MKIISGKKLAKILEKKGWALRKITGSHHIYTKEGRRERISVPVHKNKPLKVGLLRHIIKLAQIKEEEL